MPVQTPRASHGGPRVRGTVSRAREARREHRAHQTPVVTRSRYAHLRAFLAIALVVIAGLTAAVVILATTGEGTTTQVIKPVVIVPTYPVDGVRYDGGPEEGTAALNIAPASAIAAAGGARYDGGPNEGSAAANIAPASAGAAAGGARYDGGPEEGTWAIGR